MHTRLILIRPTGAARGGDLQTYSATELADHYSAAEVARLAIGLAIHRSQCTHIDLVAFHDRHRSVADKADRVLEIAGLY